MPTHLPLTEKPVPETVTNGDDDLPPSLGDVRVDRTKAGERTEKSQRARAASRGKGYMPVPVSDQAIFRPLVRRAVHRARTWESKKPWLHDPR